MPVPQIVSILKPNIEKDDVILVDRKDKRFEDLQDPVSNQSPDESNTGSMYPYISIRSVVLEIDEIKNLEIISEGFLPEISLSLSDKRNRLTNIDFPLDGDVISVYIRPNDDSVQKSIRLDFDIIDVTRSGTTSVFYDFYGVLRIPNIYDEINIFKEGTSFDALMSICSDLNLGFASNDESTNDLQKWIVAKENREKFLQDITNYSYKDDNSFFKSFVDIFYHFNFINVQKCFSLDDDLETGIISTSEPSDKIKGFEKTSSESPFIFSNSRENAGTNTCVATYSPFNNTGSVNRLNGYRRTVQFYDSENKELVDNYIEPLITKGAENLVLLKGRRDETFFKTLHKYKYMGKQNENSHPNYLFARILNHQNNEEIQKAGLKITLDSLNTDVFRYKRIALMIYDRLNTETKTSNQKRDNSEGDDTTSDYNTFDEEREVRNEFLSGFYVVDSFTLTYNNIDRFKTHLKLLRREWKPRAGTVGTTLETS